MWLLTFLGRTERMFVTRVDEVPPVQPAAVLARGLELLTEAADLLGSLTPADVPDTALGDALVEWDTLTNRLDAARTSCTRAWDAQATWSIDGAHSGATWLACHTHQARGHAAATIRLGRALRDMPATAEAFDAGEISATKARLLADAAKSAPEHFARDEAMLVGHAHDLTVENLRRSLAYWRTQAAPDDEAERTAKQHDDRHVSLSRTFQGTWRLDGTLTAETGEILHDALTRMARARYRAEKTAAEAAGEPVTSTAAQRRADALIDLARQMLVNESGSGLNVPAITALIDITKLIEDTDTNDPVGTTHAGSPVTADTAFRLLCDCHLSRVITNGTSTPVDLGMTSRLPSPAQRRALALRDGGCTFPGCDRPPDWCSAHHITHWAKDGPTDLYNLTLLCSFHHHRVHEGGFGLRRRSDGQLDYTRPDGTPLTVPRSDRPIPLEQTA